MGDRGGMGVDSETIPEDDAVGTDDIVGKLAKPEEGRNREGGWNKR